MARRSRPVPGVAIAAGSVVLGLVKIGWRGRRPPLVAVIPPGARGLFGVRRGRHSVVTARPSPPSRVTRPWRADTHTCGRRAKLTRFDLPGDQLVLDRAGSDRAAVAVRSR